MMDATRGGYVPPQTYAVAEDGTMRLVGVKHHSNRPHQITPEELLLQKIQALHEGGVALYHRTEDALDKPSPRAHVLRRCLREMAAHVMSVDNAIQDLVPVVLSAVANHDHLEQTTRVVRIRQQ